jgi:hypothetical protein
MRATTADNCKLIMMLCIIFLLGAILTELRSIKVRVSEGALITRNAINRAAMLQYMGHTGDMGIEFRNGKPAHVIR